MGVRAAPTMTMDSDMEVLLFKWIRQKVRRVAIVLKALRLVVGKNIQHLPGLDALLVALPEGGVEQVGMVGHEGFAHRLVAEQEGAEGLGEHVLRADRVPDFAAHLVLLVARRRARVRKLQSVRYSISS